MLMAIACQSDRSNNTKAEDERSIYLDDYKKVRFKWGYIDREGALAIPARYDDTRDFSDGMGAVNLEGLWGYINARNEAVVDPQYRTALDFSEGLGIVQNFDGEYLTLDSKGAEIHRNRYEEQHPYQDQRSKVKSSTGYGYINTDGIQLDSLNYLSASNYHNGRAVIRDVEGYFLIDKDQNRINKQAYLKIFNHKKDIIRYKQKDHYGHFYASTGQILPDQWDRCGDYLDGYAMAVLDGSYYILDSLGQKVSTPYKSLRNLGQGRFAYKDKGKQGILDKDGNILVQPIYDAYYRYSDGLLAFSKNDKWGYLDTQGDVVVPAIFPLVWDFHDGLARVISVSGVGFIDIEGQLRIPARFIEVRDFHEGLARVQIYR